MLIYISKSNSNQASYILKCQAKLKLVSYRNDKPSNPMKHAHPKSKPQKPKQSKQKKQTKSIRKTHSMRTLEAPSETKRVRLSCTQLSAAFNEALRLRSMEFGMPTVTRILEPDRDWRTSGSASNSFTLPMLLALSSSTTFCGGRGCDAAVPQLTPMHSTLEGRARSSRREIEREMGVGVRFRGGISAVEEFRAPPQLPVLLAVARYLC